MRSNSPTHSPDSTWTQQEKRNRSCTWKLEWTPSFRGISLESPELDGEWMKVKLCMLQRHKVRTVLTMQWEVIHASNKVSSTESGSFTYHPQSTLSLIIWLSLLMCRVGLLLIQCPMKTVTCYVKASSSKIWSLTRIVAVKFHQGDSQSWCA